MKQQWITSNQAQSTEGVIMHTAAASLSLCKPSLSLSLFLLPLSPALSLSQSALGRMINLRLLIPWECGRDWKRERERGRGGGSIQYSEERLAAALASGSLRFRKKKKRSQWVQSLESARSPPSTPPFFFFSHLPCSSLPFISPLPFSSSFSFSFPLLPPPPSLCPLPPKLSVNIQQKKRPSVSATSRKEPRAERKKCGRANCLGKKNKNICPS